MGRSPSLQGINLPNIFIGSVALWVGLFVYLTDRPVGEIYFIWKANIPATFFQGFPDLFRGLGGSLPSFLHVFSFSLLTAGLFPCRRRGWAVLCAVWLFVDCLFEVGQKYPAWTSAMIPRWFEAVPFLENSRNYFFRGTFDYLDLVASVAGAAAACSVLYFTSKKGMKP